MPYPATHRPASQSAAASWRRSFLAEARALPESFADYLEASFRLLAVQIPAGYRRLVTRLGAIDVLLAVDDELCIVRARGEALQVERVRPSALDDQPDDTETPRPRVECTSSAILQVIDGRCTLHEAILDGSVRAQASLEVLDVLLRCLDLYTHCGVRCRGFEPLLESFRSWHQYRDRRDR